VIHAQACASMSELVVNGHIPSVVNIIVADARCHHNISDVR
jgi:hypothetical protein